MFAVAWVRQVPLSGPSYCLRLLDRHHGGLHVSNSTPISLFSLSLYSQLVTELKLLGWLSRQPQPRGTLASSLGLRLPQPTSRLSSAISTITLVRQPPTIQQMSLERPLTNLLVGQMKRAVGTAIMVGGGGCGGVIAANAFRQQDAPQYLPGLYTAIAVQALSIVLVSKNFLVFSVQNRKAERGQTTHEGTEGFRYTY